MSPPLRIEKLQREHSIDSFDCNSEPLNRFLTRYALSSQQSGASQTYLAVRGSEVVGYYSLVVGHLNFDEAPERLRKGMARHPIPLVVLARLAVSAAWQSKGLGSGLFKDAMLRTLQAANIAGVRALAVHAKDDSAKTFYERFGFNASPTDPLHLYRLIKDIRAFLAVHAG